LFFCESARQALLAQQLILHDLPIDEPAIGQAEAGSRTTLVKSAITKKTAKISRLTTKLIAQVATESNPRSSKACDFEVVVCEFSKRSAIGGEEGMIGISENLPVVARKPEPPPRPQ